MGNKCASCGESRPEALIAGSKPMVCAECKRRQKGQSVMDYHHVAGKRNHDLKIPVLANDHRAVLTPAMYEWPKETRENPDGSPLLAATACIRGFCDFVIYLTKNLLLWAAELLEALHEALEKRYGKQYWKKLGIKFPKWRQ
jgi:hypothetical protein